MVLQFFIAFMAALAAVALALVLIWTISRSYGRYPQNDFSGRNALLGLEWQLTPRTQLSGTLRYDVEPAQDFVSSYVATKRLGGGLVGEQVAGHVARVDGLDQDRAARLAAHIANAIYGAGNFNIFAAAAGGEDQGAADGQGQGAQLLDLLAGLQLGAQFGGGAGFVGKGFDGCDGHADSLWVVSTGIHETRLTPGSRGIPLPRWRRG